MQKELLIITYEDYKRYLEKQYIAEKNEEYKLSKVDNEHDKLFRSLLKDKQEAIKFINKYLKLSQLIEEDEIKLYDTKFITKNYKYRESDIVYKIKDKPVFILIEHQSSVDSIMAYRMLEYSFEIIKDNIELKEMKKQGYKFPVVIPIVIYTGSNTWSAEIKFERCQIEFEKYINKHLKQDYNLVNVNDYSIKELLQDNTMISNVMAIEKAVSKKQVIEILNTIVNKDLDEKQREQLENIIRYVLSKSIEKEETEKIIKKLKKEEKGGTSMLSEMIARENAELIRKGRTQGISQGISVGRSEGLACGLKQKQIEIAEKMLAEGVDTAFIIRVTGITEEELKKLKNK